MRRVVFSGITPSTKARSTSRRNSWSRSATACNSLFPSCGADASQAPRWRDRQPGRSSRSLRADRSTRAAGGNRNHGDPCGWTESRGPDVPRRVPGVRSPCQSSLADLVEAYVGDAVLLRGRRAYGCFPDLLVERLSMYIHNGEGHMMESRMRDDHGLKRRLFSDGEGCGQPSARSR
jgi:hypothetical protein